MQPWHEAPQEGGIHMHRVACQARRARLDVLRHKGQDLQKKARHGQSCIGSEKPHAPVMADPTHHQAERLHEIPLKDAGPALLREQTIVLSNLSGPACRGRAEVFVHVTC